MTCNLLHPSRGPRLLPHPVPPIAADHHYSNDTHRRLYAVAEKVPGQTPRLLFHTWLYAPTRPADPPLLPATVDQDSSCPQPRNSHHHRTKRAHQSHLAAHYPYDAAPARAATIGWHEPGFLRLSSGTQLHRPALRLVGFCPRSYTLAVALYAPKGDLSTLPVLPRRLRSGSRRSSLRC